MSLCCFRMMKNDEAARVVGGSDTDGRADKTTGLPFAVVGLHVNLPAFSHPEMASDKNRFVSNFALCAGALIKLNCNGYFHFNNDDFLCLRAESGPLRVHPSVLFLNKRHLLESKCLKNQA